MNEITVKKCANENNLELLAGKEGLNRKISCDDISRPGLEFNGFFE